MSFCIGLVIITIYYNFSSSLKYSYLNLKNSYAKDNKHLAVITENGIWIKDEFKENINIINANKFNKKMLYGVILFNLIKILILKIILFLKKYLLKKKTWLIKNAFVTNSKVN